MDLLRLPIVLMDLPLSRLASEMVSFTLLAVRLVGSFSFEATEMPFERETKVLRVLSLRHLSINCRILV